MNEMTQYEDFVKVALKLTRIESDVKPDAGNYLHIKVVLRTSLL